MFCQKLLLCYIVSALLCGKFIGNAALYLDSCSANRTKPQQHHLFAFVNISFVVNVGNILFLES